MTYSAPRLGLFATIILLSLTLNVLLFVITHENQLASRHETIAQQEAQLLAEALTTPLIINDHVGMSVLANRHIQTQDVAFIAVHDSQNNLLISVGNQSTGVMAQQMITSQSNILGHTSVQMNPISRAEIISNSWVYLAWVAFLHIVLWLFYSHLAKPSKKLRQTIAHDVRNRLLAKELIHEVNHERHHDTHTTSNDATSSATQTSGNDTNTNTNAPKPNLNINNAVAVQIVFEDPNDLLATVSTYNKNAYFSLCYQLIAKALHELLDKPLFYGVSIAQMSEFSDKGCVIVLQAKDQYSKNALACILLSHLVLTLNQTIYNKHRELKRFALNMRTFVATPARLSDVMSVGIKHRKTPLVLLSPRTLDSLISHGDFTELSDPISVAERECRYSQNLSLSHVQTIEQVRNKVLSSA